MWKGDSAFPLTLIRRNTANTLEMKKSRILHDALSALLILTILIFLELPYLPVVLSSILVVGYSTLKTGIGNELGFIRPKQLFQSIGIAMMMAIVLVASSFFLFGPALELITGEAINLGPFAQLKGNTSFLLISIAIGWIIGGFMEEIIFRGFFLSRIIDLFPGKKGVILGILLTSLLFGYLHDYQGITGQLLTGLIGAILGGIYVLNQRKIWLNILLHGSLNTISMLLLYAGIA